MSVVSDWKRGVPGGSKGSVHPSGSVNLAELTDVELEGVEAGIGTAILGTLGCCWCVPWYSGFTHCGSICGGRCEW